MFGFFKGKSNQPSVSPQQKKWIEEYFIWFVKIFGTEKLIEKPFFLLNHDDFPYSDLKDEVQFEKLLLQLCNHLNINVHDISVLIFDDFASKQWNTYIPFSGYKFHKGLFNETYNIDEKRYKIRLAQSIFENHAVLITVLFRELMKVRLIGGRLIQKDEKNKYAVIDLACLYFGMGIIFANASVTSNTDWLSSNSNLMDRELSYANALICYVSKINGANYFPLLNTNTKALFKQDFEYLTSTDDTLLNEKNIAAAEMYFKLYRQIKQGFKQKKFDEVIAACKTLLEVKKLKTVYVFNNWGYALLKQKKYKEAIEYFDKAIGIDPFTAYSYNNRGYCKLNLNDLEHGFVDIQSSIDLNPENAFAWRNLGVYYLKMDNAQTALEHFNTALNLNRDTELIHFYLSKAFEKLNNQTKLEEHLKISLEKEEYNDGTFF